MEDFISKNDDVLSVGFCSYFNAAESIFGYLGHDQILTGENAVSKPSLTGRMAFGWCGEPGVAGLNFLVDAYAKTVLGLTIKKFCLY